MNKINVVVCSCLLLHSFSITMVQAQSVETPPAQTAPSAATPASPAAAPAPVTTPSEEAKKKEAAAAAEKSAQASKTEAEVKTKVEAAQKAAEDKKTVEEKEVAEKKKAAEEKQKSETEQKKLEQEKKEAEQKSAEEKKQQEEKQKKEEQEKAAAAQKAEEKPKEQPKAMTAEGMDTLEQEGGNWLLKRQALEKTVDIIEQINGFFTKILEARIDFLVKRNKIDRDFDVFINKIGFEFGDLSRTLATLVEELGQQRKAIGELPEEERQALAELDAKEKELQDLQQQLKDTSDLLASLDDVIMQLEKEVNIANTYQANAWKNFQAIKKVLNDEKAEELYLETQGLLKNMQAIDAYLKDKLFNYFNGIINNIKTGMSTIQTSFKSLEEKGIDLKAEVDKFLNINQTKIQEKSCEEADRKRDEAIKKVKAQKTSEGWLSWIAPLWEYPLHFFEQAWDFVMSFFTPSEVAVVKRRTNVEKSAKEPETKAINPAGKV